MAGSFANYPPPDPDVARSHRARHPEWYGARRGDTAQYPAVVEPARPPVPTWAAVTITLLIVFDVAAWAFAAWAWYG